MSEKCQKCGEEGEDRRTLWMACFYEMNELGLPFELVKTEKHGQFYTLRVCKDCRAGWMKAIKEWFFKEKLGGKTGSGFYFREYGATREY